jgi:protein ImuA
MRSQPVPVARPESLAGAGIPLIEALRRHIARLEGSQPRLDARRRRERPWTVGLAPVDSHLGAHGLARSRLHDISPEAYGDMPAAMGFALALALRRLADAGERRPLLWCRLAFAEREYGRLYGHGLEALGLPRDRFITVTLRKPAGLLWTMEEALKSGALAVVLGDALDADLTATRRLSLAAQAGKTAGLVVFKTAPAATASHTRWRIAAAASRPPPYDPRAPGPPAWSVELTRARSGRPGAWTLEWHHATHRFDLVPGLPRRALHSWTDESPALAAAQEPALRAG